MARQDVSAACVGLMLVMLAGCAIAGAPPPSPLPDFDLDNAVTLETVNDTMIISAEDLVIKDPEGKEEDIAIMELIQELASLRALTAECNKNVTDAFRAVESKVVANTNALDELVANGSSVSGVVAASIEAATQGVFDQILRTRESKKGTLEGKITRNKNDIESFDATRDTVDLLAIDVDYLIDHADNITTCAIDAFIHSGNGVCVPVVPKCEAPSAPNGGQVVLSNSAFIVPGVTATYSCDSKKDFVDGPSVRVCDENTNTFVPEMEPVCTTCGVEHCLTCSASDMCALCNHGFDRTADHKMCVERKQTLFTFGYTPPNSGHNGQQSYMLPPGSGAWNEFLPRPPTAFTQGGGTIIGNEIFMARSNCDFYIFSSSAWSKSSISIPHATACDQPFYATINNENTPNENGFYHYGRNGGAVFKPNGAAGGAWTVLKQHPEGQVTSGATVVIGTKIYFLGGYRWSGTRATLDKVYSWDATQDASGSFKEEPSMITASQGHAATAYGGKIYMFGGMKAKNSAKFAHIDVFDPTTQQWTRLSTTMPQGWSWMTTGSLPVYPNGDVMFLGAALVSGIAEKRSLAYNIQDDKWRYFPTQDSRFWGGRNIALLAEW